jgi:hypothetical protein
MSGSETLFRRRIQIIDAIFEIITNAPWLATDETYFGPHDVQSLLTNYYTVLDVEADDPRPNSAIIYLMNQPGIKLSVRADSDILFVAGDLLALEHALRDKRYSMFGNLGLFFRYSLAVLQNKHGIISMHASAFYHPEKDDLLVVGGGSGAGKSVYLFEGLKEGYQVFTAEMTLFRIDQSGITLFKGALHDNVWTGSIQGEYAQIIQERLGVQSLQARQDFLAKAVVDLTPVAVKADVLHNPRILMLLSRIEQERQTCTFSSFKDKAEAAAKVYEVASEKMQSGYVLYGTYAAPVIDTDALAQARLDGCRAFVEGHWMRDVRKVIAGPNNCLQAIV